jgi:hypothetical protein
LGWQAVELLEAGNYTNPERVECAECIRVFDNRRRLKVNLRSVGPAYIVRLTSAAWLIY